MLDRVKMGENIFELIEFSIERNLGDGKVMVGRYGVNVAKVREVVRMPLINPLASSIPGVAGIFEIRGVPIPAIHLAVLLGDKQAKIKPTHQIIVVEFSRRRAGFIVDRTEKIRRVSWEAVLSVGAEKAANISGMTIIENNEFLFIVDLERIVQSIETAVDHDGNPNSERHANAQASLQMQNLLKSYLSQGNQEFRPSSHGTGDGEKIKILLIDDSKFIIDHVSSYLVKAGFRVVSAKDGAEAKSILEGHIEGRLNEAPIDIVVTDVEMPRMDGLSLTKWIKGHPKLAQMPVIIHSSLSSKANLEAGIRLGVNGYVIKNDLRKLLDLIKEIIGENYVPGTLFKAS